MRGDGILIIVSINVTMMVGGRCVCSKISYSEQLARCRQRLTCKQKEFAETEASLTDDSHSSTSSNINIRLPSALLTYLVVVGTCGENYDYLKRNLCLQCFDAVGWAAGRASGL